MNQIATVKLTRPPGVADSDPCPIPISNTLMIKGQALYTNGQPISLTAAKIYVTIKAALSDADNAAKYQKNSTDNPTIVYVDNAALGLYTVAIPAGALVTASLSADTNYYIDTTIIASTGVFTHVYDIIRPFQQVTKSTT